MDDVSPALSRCTFCHVTAVRSCDVNKGHQNVFWLIASDKKELQQCACSHCVQLIKTHRIIYMLELWKKDQTNPWDVLSPMIPELTSLGYMLTHPGRFKVKI